MHPSSGDARRRGRRLALGVLAAVVLTTLTGCPSSPSPSPSAEGPGGPSPADAAPAGPGTDDPADPGPPAGAPDSTGPLRTVEGTVELTSAAPGIFSRVEQAVATPDGAVHVTLTPVDSSGPPRLGTVRRTAGGFGVTGSLELTGVDDVWGLHLLADGDVVVTGSLRSAAGARSGYGLAVVDPATGSVRTTVVEPYAGKVRFAFGRSALAADGRTLYLYLSTLTGAGDRERLVAVDTSGGTVTADRDLAADVSAVSESPAGHELAGMVPQADGGVTLVVDATPDVTRADRIPTLLRFDGELQPAGDPVQVTSQSEQGRTRAVAAGSDGTTFLVVQVGHGSSWVMAVPPGSAVGPVLAEITDPYGYALVVEPAEVWGLLPAPDGARPVDLSNGDLREPVDVGCPGQDVRDLFPGARGRGAVLIGECNAPRSRTQMLWILGP
jgi:hypothetical protein